MPCLLDLKNNHFLLVSKLTKAIWSPTEDWKSYEVSKSKLQKMSSFGLTMAKERT